MRILTKLLVSLRRHGAVLAIGLVCAVAGPVHAQTATGDEGAEPPARVARLSHIAGELGLLPAGASDWNDADLNRPLTTGDKLSSGAGARAELEFGGATLRLDQRTDLGLLDLNDQMAQVELTQGTLNLSVQSLDDGQSYEIDTPTVALVINQPGRFRVDIDGNETRVTAFEGNATVYGENNAQRDVFAGRSYRFVDSSLAAVAISDISGGDSFDAWVDQRNQRYAQSDNDQYVPDDMVGTPDLREYGAWQSTSDYGAVWYPNDVGPDWAPYRTGNWAYIAPWGWTWIDAMPWGFAPYHYGRWAHTPRGWGWIPGPRHARPIYAPALVAFVGGGGFSVGIGSGPIGWFPLGPGEIYNPWYRCNRDYYQRVNVSNIRLTRNITNVTIINNINNHYGHYRDNRPMSDERYVNRRAPGGFSAMSGRQFAAGQRVQRNLVKVDPRQLEAARVVPHGVDLRPQAGGQSGQRSAHVRQLPLGGFQREVVARHAPPSTLERHIGPSNNLATSPRTPSPRSNVRVLNPRAGVSVNQRPVAGSRVDPGAERARLPRASNVIPNAPIVQRRQAIEQPNQGALPSARFAHPRDRNQVGESSSMPRPGVSYISGADQDNRQQTPRSSLPQVPRIQRADSAGQPVPIRREQLPRSVVNQPRMATPEPGRPEARVQRMEPNRPTYTRDEARPQPVRREPPPQPMQQPRYEAPRYAQPQQRASAPPVRAEAAARPQRSEAHSERKPAPRPHDDGQRQ
ncbi:MAG TPA: DUF6600 domain-containing protein [Rhodanobacter sp.]|nr:DUF6600 domain-containing protein [Rhodanobacter sp.]